MNKDQVEGNAKEARGKAKEIAGEVTGNESLKYKGKAEQVAGKAQSKYGDAKDELNENE